jgi:hypothetical protein
VATSKAKPADYTGRQRQVLAEQAADELAQRQGEISMAQQVERQKMETEIVDFSEGTTPSTIVLDEVTSVAPELTEEFAIIRVVEDIEDMTFGAGNLYTFKVGQKYKVTKQLADHLDEKGYIYSR